MNRLFYSIVRIFLKINVYLFLHPKVIGKENITKNNSLVLAGNHTSWHKPGRFGQNPGGPPSPSDGKYCAPPPRQSTPGTAEFL